MSKTSGTSRKNVSTLRLRLRLSAFQQGGAAALSACQHASGPRPSLVSLSASSVRGHAPSRGSNPWRFSRAADEAYHPAEMLRAADRREAAG